MEQTNEICRQPKYTMGWLGLRLLFIFGMALFMPLLAVGIESLASSRVADGLLGESCFKQLSDAIVYCFGIVLITSVSLMLEEVAFRKDINYLQYALIAMALTLFYLLLLALSEHLPFVVAYAIVSVMTIGLIALFVKGITQKMKAVGLTLGVLTVEYGMVLVLIMLGSMALLIGSLSLFLLLSLAMYFTLKLKIENEELIIK